MILLKKKKKKRPSGQVMNFLLVSLSNICHLLFSNSIIWEMIELELSPGKGGPGKDIKAKPESRRNFNSCPAGSNSCLTARSVCEEARGDCTHIWVHQALVGEVEIRCSETVDFVRLLHFE